MKSPKLYVAMDTCFAIKRWVLPSEWMPVIQYMGAQSIEASTDNEIDPLFAPENYLQDWFDDVAKLEETYHMKVRSFFTGYQTYRTAGLTHPDARVRTKLKNLWFKPLIQGAGKLGADIGFSFHAIREADLASQEAYETAVGIAIDEYAELASYAKENKGVKLCCEQMYAPYQHPFTIESSKKLIHDVYGKNHDPFYIAVDVGHMVGQRKYRLPNIEQIIQAVGMQRNEGRNRGIWLGPEYSYRMVKEQALSNSRSDLVFAKQLLKDLQNSFAHMFSHDERDDDPHAWLKELGAYSPIIHLQQTNGKTSSHAPFTSETNKEGIISPRSVLEALKKSYTMPDDPTMPPKTDRITLAFEIFISNTMYPHDALDELKESVQYWKQYIPRDGMTLDEALSLLD